MKSRAIFIVLLLSTFAFAQQKNPPAERVQKSTQAEKPAQPPAPTEQPATQPQPKPQPESQPQRPSESRPGEQGPATWHFDMTEVPPVVTHHEVKMADGKVLRYTATAGRLPIKELDGTIAAEMFFVAYTLDGQDPSRRPVTFAFNGGPGSASMWLHMGALGPRKVVLGPEGFLPPPPYRLEDNAYTPLDKTDLVLV